LYSLALTFFAIATGLRGTEQEMVGKLARDAEIGSIPILLFVGTWACVGIIRAAIKTLRTSQVSPVAAIGSCCALAWSLLLATSYIGGAANLLK
jgi:hypothetical protein